MRLSINLVFEIGAKENIFRMIHNHAFSQGGLASLTKKFQIYILKRSKPVIKCIQISRSWKHFKGKFCLVKDIYFQRVYLVTVCMRGTAAVCL